MLNRPSIAHLLLVGLISFPGFSAEAKSTHRERVRGDLALLEGILSDSALSDSKRSQYLRELIPTYRAQIRKNSKTLGSDTTAMAIAVIDATEADVRKGDLRTARARILAWKTYLGASK
jgi:hypothetical protein